MQYDDAKRDKYSYLNAFKYLFSNHEGIYHDKFQGKSIKMVVTQRFDYIFALRTYTT